jgi:hypothetical protein
MRTLFIFRNPLFNLPSKRNVTLAIIVALVIWLQSFSPLTIGRLPQTAAFGLPPNSRTLPTCTAAMIGMRGVPGCEFVALNAMGFSRVFPATHVDQLGNRFQMLRVDALANTAEMVQNQSLRYGPLELLPRKDVGQSVDSLEAQTAITVTVQPSSPKPAGGGFENPRVESFIDIRETRPLHELCQLAWSDDPEAASVDVAPTNVFGNTAWLQMVRVDALCHPALMVKRQCGRHATKFQFIGKPVSPMALAIECECPITERINRSDPKPARRSFQDSGIKGFIDRESVHSSVCAGFGSKQVREVLETL